MEGDTTVKEAFEAIQKATEEIRGVFEKFHLTQTQAACASACALNQMTSVQEGWPKIATVYLSSALTLQDS